MTENKSVGRPLAYDEEYKDLAKELETIGYNLKILNK